MTTMSAEGSTGAAKRHAVYNREFWLAYIANLVLVTANAMNFRFAEFVKTLGGTEQDVGAIAAAALYISLVGRFWLARALDRVGVARMWRMSSVGYVLGAAILLFVRELGPAIYFARILTAISIAGMFACSLCHIQSQVPPARRTEVIAMLGSSGFLGMILGSQIIDAEFLLLHEQSVLYRVMFGSIAGLGGLYFAIVAHLTDGHLHIAPEHTPPAWTLLRRYWPGLVAAAAFVIGMGLAVTTVFLTRFATERGLSGIRTFFTAYAATAFFMRLMTRSWHHRIGRHRLIVLGMAGHAACQWALAGVQSDAQFILPGIYGGFGHSLLFPCVVSLGAGVFPLQFRGTGTTLTLGFMDLGTAVTSPLFGTLIDSQGFATMFHCAAAATATIGVLYGIATFRRRDDETRDRGAG